MSYVYVTTDVEAGEVEVDLGQAGYVNVDVGTIYDVDVRIEMEDIVEQLDDDYVKDLIDRYQEKKNSDTMLIELDCKTIEDEQRIKFLEKVYNKIELSELEKIFEGRV